MTATQVIPAVGIGERPDASRLTPRVVGIRGEAVHIEALRLRAKFNSGLPAFDVAVG